jgi:hypothetical protein
MRLLRLALIGAMLLSPFGAWAKGVHSRGPRPAYGGGKHTTSHGGAYKGGHGSSHKGGKYKSSEPCGNCYGTHK